MNIRNVGRGWRLVDTIVLLSFVLLLLSASALAQPGPLQEEPVSAPSPQAAPQDDELQDPREDPQDCLDPSRPASAQHLLPYPEQEVGVTYKIGDNTSQEYMYYDYSARPAPALRNRATTWPL